LTRISGENFQLLVYYDELNLVPLVKLAMWDCIEENCGHSVLRKLTEEEKNKILDCVSRALFEWEAQVKECWQDFENCMHCKDKDN